MPLRSPGPARGRGRGRPPGGPRGRLSPPWSPAWLCCWVLAGCQAAWARDLPSSGRPLPPCQEVSRTWSFTWSCGGGGGGSGRRGRGAACVWRSAPAPLLPGRKLPAPGSWPRAGVWLRCLSGDASLSAPLCSEGSEGLCGALFGVSGLRTRGRGRCQPGAETGAAPPVGSGDPSLHSFSRGPDTANGGRVFRASPAPLPSPPLPGLYKLCLPTPLRSASR